MAGRMVAAVARPPGTALSPEKKTRVGFQIDVGLRLPRAFTSRRMRFKQEGYEGKRYRLSPRAWFMESSIQ